MSKHIGNHPAPKPRFDGPITSMLATTFLRSGHYAILSAERVGFSAEDNAERTRRLAEELNILSMTYVPTVYQWDGESEHGFLVFLNEKKPGAGWPMTDATGRTVCVSDETRLTHLAARFERDSILVANNGAAFIVECGSHCTIDSFARLKLLDPHVPGASTIAKFPGTYVRFLWE